MNQAYKEMFAKAQEALEKLHTAKANLEEKLTTVSAEIEAMTQTANAIAPLIGEQRIPALTDFIPPIVGTAMLKAAGITVAVRVLFDSRFSEDLNARMVKDLLQEQGWDWTNYTNPLSTIHTVLKRLFESGAIKETEEPKGLVPTLIAGKKYYSAKRDFYQSIRPLGGVPSFHQSLMANMLEPPPLRVTADMTAAFRRGLKKKEEK